jgi:D-alanyl-D-alanine carboxypeptidase
VVSLKKLLTTKARAFILAASGFALAAAAAGAAQAEALLLVDVETGKVISEQNATTPWYPASVTKLMTTYITFKALRDERIKPETLFVVTPRAVAQQPSKMGFKPGTRVTVDNALKMMLVHSANDMAVVLAEGVGGSIDKFAELMNREAERLGMTQTHYVNPNGLPNEQQVTSARDLAILARALLLDFPQYDAYWHIASIRLGKRIYKNTNKLIDAYAGSDGMKTGFICASGYNLVATATRNNKRLIAVVLGAASGNGRALKAAQMFERGFGTNLLAMLTPQSTVEALVPVSAAPPDMHDEVCSKDPHHQPPAEDGDEANANTAGGYNVSDLSGTHSQQPGLLTPGLSASIAPVDVYSGPARPAGWTPPPAPPARRRPGAVAAKPAAARSAPAAAAVRPKPAPRPAAPRSPAPNPAPPPAAPAGGQ